MMKEKEEKAIILDFLPNGYPLEGRMMPVAQAIGASNFVLLQLVPRHGVSLQLKEEVYIGEGKRDKIHYILGRLPKNKLTETAKMQLAEHIEKTVQEREEKYVRFFNESQPINTRLHQLELLPGFGKKHTQAIIEARKSKPFASFEDIKQRVKNIPDPKKAIEKRLTLELQEDEKYLLFAG